MDLSFYQHYWWVLVSVLGAVLVFMLFVQGGQTLLVHHKSPESRRLIVNSLGQKWELTFTTLVVFGGAFFASFPLFYSTSFGGAYWLWMLILLSFVLQAVSYEFRSKPGNLLGTPTFDSFLFINGLVGCVLLGVAVGTLFFGGDFIVDRENLVSSSAMPVISQWASTRGLEAIASWRCLLLGFAVFFLARTLASLYFVNNISDARTFGISNRTSVLFNGVIFAILFVGFLAVLFMAPGATQNADGTFVMQDYIYLNNLLAMPWALILFLAGVIMVLYGIFRTAFTTRWRGGIWFAGIGTVIVVFVLFLLAGFGSTAYLRSISDLQSSLSIANSSSSMFTLKVMSVVSLAIPFVIAYIAYVWHCMNRKQLTAADVDADSHSY